jgi:hypothetical protein
VSSPNPLRSPNLTFRPKRFNSFAVYLLVLAGLISLQAIYQRFLVPLLEGPPNIVQHDFAPPSTDLNYFAFEKENFLPLFPADAWELEDCKVMLAEQGVVLFREFVRVEGGYLEVLPFTLIMDANVSRFPDPSVDPEKTPTVLRCLRGARLKFDDPYADPLGGKSKLESARLVGPVDIYRPATSKGGDALEIITSNVQITNKQIFTLEEVRFAFGGNRGWGRQLLIELSHDQKLRSATNHGFENVNGVRRLELAFLRQLRLEPTVRDAVPGGTTPAAASSVNQSPIDITCEGAFVLDVFEKTAEFNERVLVRQLHEDRNELTCERLTVQFQDGSQGRTANEPPLDAGGLPGSWEAEKLVAEGAPAVLTSAAHALRLEGDLVSYDLSKGEFYARMESATSPVGLSPQFSPPQFSPPNRPAPISSAVASGSGLPVSIVTPEYQVQATQLAYRLNPLGGLGQLMAAGPGNLLQLESPRSKEFFLQWKKFLSVEPEGDQHLITVEEGCSVRFDQQNLLKARRILLWLQESVPPSAPLVTVEEEASPRNEYLPRRLVATDQVEIISPQLKGQTSVLTAIWESDDPPADHSALRAGQLDRWRMVHSVARPQVGSDANPRLQPGEVRYAASWRAPATGTEVKAILQRDDSQPLSQPLSPTMPGQNYDPGHPVHPWPTEAQVQPAGFWVQPDPYPGTGVGQRPVPFEDPASEPKQYAFQAQEVRLQLSPGDHQIQDLTATGQVRLAEIQSSSLPGSPAPLVIQGDLLRYLPQANELARVLASGTPQGPARVDAAGFQLTGNEIHLDQAANKLWVDGPGELLMEVAGSERKPAAPGSATIDTAAVRYRDVKVSWASGMVFNGRKVYFEDQVVLVAEGISDQQGNTITRAFGGGVSIELEQEVNFSQLDSSSGQKQDIREMVLVEQVAAGRRIFQLANFNGGPRPDRPNDAGLMHQMYDPRGNLLEQLEFFATQITLIAKTGVLNGKGPGSIWHYRKGQPSLMADSNPDRRAAPPARPADGGELAFLRINYDGTATASTQQQRLQIRGNVRTVYSPVRSFEQQVNPDDKRSFPDDAVLVRCDNLDFAQWTPRNSEQPVQELFASGNAHVTSSAFEAKADRINYNQATDLVVIEGTPRSDAQLWHQANLGNVRDRKHLIAEKIIYRLKDGNTEFQNIKYMDYKQN